MKFRLLEIESVQSARALTSDGALNQSGVRRIKIQIENLPSQFFDAIQQLAIQYSRILSVESFSSDRMTVDIDISQSQTLQADQNQYLSELMTYTARIGENLAYCQRDWKNIFGLSLREPRIMGVVNVTPDSFSDGGQFLALNDALNHARRLISEGADIIDIGGESSRPGAAAVAVDIELDRVLPVIRHLRRESDVPIAIDTYKAQVARAALEAGADWINDITGCRGDDNMVKVAAEFNVPVIVMHMLGTPQTMQDNPVYDHVVADITRFFEERIKTLTSNGVSKIILDPGIGFGKRLEHNITILQNLKIFKQFGYPLLVGTSRKSFIGAITGKDSAQREAGTLATVVWSVQQGANVVRVHDVDQTRDTLEIINTF